MNDLTLKHNGSEESLSIAAAKILDFALNRPYRLHLKLKNKNTCTKWLGRQVVFECQGLSIPGRIQGIIQQPRHCEIIMTSPLHDLAQTRSHIYTKTQVKDVILQLTKPLAVKINWLGDIPSVDELIQYQETNMQCLHRVIHQFNLYYLIDVTVTPWQLTITSKPTGSTIHLSEKDLLQPITQIDQRLKLHCHLKRYNLGDLLNLSTIQHFPLSNKNWRIDAIEIHLGTGNQIILFAGPHQRPTPKTPLFNNTFATLKSGPDDQGRYTLAYDFSPSTVTKSFRLLPFSHAQQGLDCQLSAESRVLCIKQKDTHIILGAVDSLNYDTEKITLQQHGQLSFCAKAYKISLSYNKSKLILKDNTLASVELKSQKKMTINAAQGMSVRSDSYYFFTGKSIDRHCQELMITSQQLQLQAGQNLTFQAKVVKTLCTSNYAFTANDIHLQCQRFDLAMNRIQMQATGNIELTSAQAKLAVQHTLKLQCGNYFIEFSKAGIQIKAEKIKFITDKLQFKANSFRTEPPKNPPPTKL
jgi:hypothetical protein